MQRDTHHLSQLRLTGLLLAVALFSAACGGGEETASGVASIADVEVAATSEPDPDEEASTAVESADDAVVASTGHDDTADPNVVANESGTGEDPVVEDESAPEDATDEEMALAFVACVREAGFDQMPDPTVQSDGTVQLLPPGQQQLLADPDFQEAAEGCVVLIEEATFFQAAPDISAFADDLLGFAQCLRDNGVDVEDPDLSRFVPGQGARMFGDDFDPQDPANADAIAACQSLLPNAAGN